MCVRSKEKVKHLESHTRKSPVERDKWRTDTEGVTTERHWPPSGVLVPEETSGYWTEHEGGVWTRRQGPGLKGETDQDWRRGWTTLGSSPAHKGPTVDKVKVKRGEGLGVKGSVGGRESSSRGRRIGSPSPTRRGGTRFVCRGGGGGSRTPGSGWEEGDPDPHKSFHGVLESSSPPPPDLVDTGVGRGVRRS